MSDWGVAMSAGGEQKKLRFAQLRLDFGTQCNELFPEQRAHDQRQNDQVLKKACCRRKPLRREGGQRSRRSNGRFAALWTQARSSLATYSVPT